MTPQEEAEIREVLLEVIRSPEGRELIAEIRARKQHQQEAAQHED